MATHRAGYFRVFSKELANIYSDEFIPDQKATASTVEIIVVKSVVFCALCLVLMMAQQDEPADTDYFQHLRDTAEWVERMIERVATMGDVK